MIRKVFFIGFCLLIVLTGTLNAVEYFPPEQVQLLDGPFKHAQDLNLKCLLEYDVDRLLATYRKEAGLEMKGELYPNWSGLDGHVTGHYLSAMALYTAVTGNEECRRRMNYMIDELALCQEAHGDGYAGGVPNGNRIWTSLAEGNIGPMNRAWVPWYNLDKTFAGLRDAWLLGHSEKAKDILIKFADWCYNEVSGLSDEQMQQMLNQEHGGMNEVLADVSAITGDKKYLELAQRFSHLQLLDPMSENRDTLDNKHANTQVPKAVGFQRIALLSEDEKYAHAAEFFWETVVTNRSLIFGGNSRREHFPTEQACTDFVEERQGPESCNTFNMLKLTKRLFESDQKAAYADYYERALYNHILSTQHPEHGGYVYFTPARPQHYRVYSQPNEAMWCCVGTGMENHGKYGEFIYTHDDDSLYINLFIASELNWLEKGVRIRQETKFPDEPKTVITFLSDEPVELTLKIRHPSWVPAGQLKFKMGTVTWVSETKPSSYAEIKRTWQKGDRIEVSLPMHTTIEAMPNVPDYVAFLYGPIVLGAKTGTEDLEGLVADDGRWSHIANGPLIPLETAPMLVGKLSEIARKVTPIEGESIRFKANEIIQPANFSDLVLEPFFRIHDARYMMYWRVTQPDNYEQTQSELKAGELQVLELDRKTIDRVIPGEQQPEADHKMQHENSESGNYQDKAYRHALAPSWFSYELEVAQDKPLALYIMYWGNESGRRTFDILVNDQKLVTENLANKWNKDEFVSVQYPLSKEITANKKYITVTFKPQSDNYAGGVFDLRIVEAD
ncbi:MAG: glycoside hydrolase family 127 protein [Sedimentisphaerales bacterium]|nr:glycoside hydrolase family 127 protein [Sedimentisphaerales bacterium]